MIRAATERDLERALDMAEAKRWQVAPYHPIFHRPAPDARKAQAPYFRDLVDRTDVITLVHETDQGVDGFVVAQTPTAPFAFWVDDFVVAHPDLWPTVGRDLLEAVRAEVRDQGGRFLQVNCQPLDRPKRGMLVDAGLTVVRQNMANREPLPTVAAAAPRPAIDALHVRRAAEEDLDKALDLVMQQREFYRRLDPVHYDCPPDRKTEHEHLLRSLRDDSSVSLAVEADVGGIALLAADHIPPPPVYDPGGPVYFIQYFVAPSGAWTTAGQTLLAVALDRMVEREAALANSFALPGDPEHAKVLRRAALSVVTEFFFEPL